MRFGAFNCLWLLNPNPNSSMFLDAFENILLSWNLTPKPRIFPCPMLLAHELGPSGPSGQHQATTRQSARARHAAKWSSPCRSWRRCDLAGDSDLMALLCRRVGTIILVWGRFLWFGFALFIWAIEIYRVPRSKLASYIPICRDGHTVLPSWTRN